jgi:hypothetical protein
MSFPPVPNINFGNKAWCQKYCIPRIWFIISKLYCCYCCSFYHASGYHASTSNLPLSFFTHSRHKDISIASVVHSMYFTDIAYSTLLFLDITNSTDRTQISAIILQKLLSSFTVFTITIYSSILSLIHWYLILHPFCLSPTLFILFVWIYTNMHSSY